MGCKNNAGIIGHFNHAIVIQPTIGYWYKLLNVQKLILKLSTKVYSCKVLQDASLGFCNLKPIIKYNLYPWQHIW